MTETNTFQIGKEIATLQMQVAQLQKAVDNIYQQLDASDGQDEPQPDDTEKR